MKKEDLFGWAAAKGFRLECLGETCNAAGCMHYNHLLGKFPQDGVFEKTEGGSCFLDGYIVNKEDFVHDINKTWKQVFVSAVFENLQLQLSKMRGGFCGYIFDAQNENLSFFTDQTSNKAIYYYVSNDGWIVSNSLFYIAEILKHNDVKYHLDENAIKYMLTYGYMIDDSTFVREVHRLLPGCFARIENGKLNITRYHEIKPNVEKMSERDAVEQIDTAFRRAVIREFEKDREYGYRHLVDLSGGLDSRMVTWVAHEEGYTDQINVTYCRGGYADQKIAQQIAKCLGHEYIYKSLDDAKWMFDVEEMTCRNNGAAVGLGMTGGNRLLQELNTDIYGIEHTGMVGDAILSTFYHDRDLSEGNPVFGLNQYSDMLHYEFDNKILERYPTQEIFAIYTRGILGAQSSYITRQHYVETASPFLDVDFLETVMKIPFEYRNRHSIYLSWIAQKYPKAAEFGWEKWGGIKPKKNLIFARKMKTTQRLIHQYGCRILHRPDTDSMNPMDCWYTSCVGVRKYLDIVFRERIADERIEESLRRDMIKAYKEGTFTEKSLVLTVLCAVNIFFE